MWLRNQRRIIVSIEVLGISGSPVNSGITDRLVKAVLDETGLETKFVKLGYMNLRPCLARKKCVPYNICKVKDDFPGLAEEVKDAKALIIGAYIPYKQIDGFTKALLERFWSLIHVNNLLRTIQECGLRVKSIHRDFHIMPAKAADDPTGIGRVASRGRSCFAIPVPVLWSLRQRPRFGKLC
jgi:hypothetical protein